MFLLAGLSMMFSLLSLSRTEIIHTFTASGPENCTVTQGTITTKSPSGFQCTEYLRTSRCNASYPAYHPDKDIDWPGRPTQMSVEPFQTRFRQTYYPAVKVTWKPPQDGSVDDVKGFEATFIPLADNNGAVLNPTRQCRLLSVTNVTDNRALMDTTFELYVFLSVEAFYFVHLYSLPKPDIERDNSNLFAYMYFQARVQNPNSPPAPANWLTSITVKNISSERKIEVGFKLAPEEFHFQTYKVTIKNLESHRKVEKTLFPDIKSDTTSVTFTGVEDGRYDVQVEPKDPYRFQEGCLCHDARNGCQSCPVTNLAVPVLINGPGETTPFIPSTSKPIAVDTSISTKEITTNKLGSFSELKVEPSENNTDRIIVGTIVGSIGAAALCVLVLFILRKGPFCKEGFSHWFKPQTPISISSVDNTGFENGLNNSAKKQRAPVLQRKKIAFIFTEDHACHKELVRYFAKYLQVYCHCDVLYPDWFLGENLSDGPIRWTLNSIDRADFTFIINSEAAYKLYKAWKEDQVYSAPVRSPRGDTFTPAICKIFYKISQNPDYRKYIMISFDHTKEEHTLSGELTQGLKYQLMKHMKELLCHIHGLNYFQDDLTLVDLPLNVNYRESTEGEKLMVAMDKARRYQIQNPYCFQNTFGDPVHKSRSDSGYSPDSAGSVSQEDVAMIRSECEAQLADSMKELNADNRTENNVDMMSIATKDALSFYPPSELDDEMLSNVYMIGSNSGYQAERKEFQQQNSNESQGYASQHGDDPYGFEPPDPSVDLDTNSRTISAQMLQINEKYHSNMDTTLRPLQSYESLTLYEDEECISLGGESV